MSKLLCLCLTALLLQGCDHGRAIQSVQRVMPGARVLSKYEYSQLNTDQFIVYYSNRVYLVRNAGFQHPVHRYKPGDNTLLKAQELTP